MLVLVSRSVSALALLLVSALVLALVWGSMLVAVSVVVLVLVAVLRPSARRDTVLVLALLLGLVLLLAPMLAWIGKGMVGKGPFCGLTVPARRIGVGIGSEFVALSCFCEKERMLVCRLDHQRDGCGVRRVGFVYEGYSVVW
jgi:hypothetical protein